MDENLENIPTAHFVRCVHLMISFVFNSSVEFFFFVFAPEIDFASMKLVIARNDIYIENKIICFYANIHVNLAIELHFIELCVPVHARLICLFIDFFICFSLPVFAILIYSEATALVDFFFVFSILRSNHTQEMQIFKTKTISKY